MLLEARNVSFSYTNKRPLINGMNVSIDEGEVVGLLGSSGCGKSTLARILAGRIEPDQGAVTWDGVPLPTSGYCPVQLISQHPELAVNPRWRLGKTLTEGWTPPAEVQAALGIEEAWKHRWPNELSGGELQRFCVARALSPQTRILICDEMTAMLDVSTQAQIWQFVTSYAREHHMGLVVITHNQHLVDKLCDRVITMVSPA